MVSSAAATPDDYLAELPADRAQIVGHVRHLVNRVLGTDVEERMAHGMIAWQVPLERSGPTRGGRPLMVAALAAQKNNYALYLNAMSADPARTEALRAAFADAGKRADLGKGCLRFKRLDDLDEPALAAALASPGVDAFIAEARGTAAT